MWPANHIKSASSPFRNKKTTKKLFIIDPDTQIVCKVCWHGTVASTENSSLCIRSMWVWSPLSPDTVKAVAMSLYKLVSTTGAALSDAAAFMASAATCWSCLAQISCTKGTLASFHSLNLSEVSSGSDNTCSIACRSASFDCARKDESKENWKN